MFSKNSELQHPSVVRLLGLYKDSVDAYMVMEYVSKGSLQNVLKKEKISLKDQMDMYLCVLIKKMFMFLKDFICVARNGLFRK